MNHADYCAQFVKVPGTVLDVGSGRGKFVCAMAERGYTVTGIEINRGYIEESQKLAQEKGVTIQVIEGSAEHLPFDDTMFGFINASEVTEHVEDPVKMCREIYRVLQNGGSTYLSFHNRFGAYDYHYHLWGINWIPRSWTERVLYFFGRQKEDGVAGRQKLCSMHYYTYKKAIKLLMEIGFDVQDVREEKIRKQYPRGAWILLLIYRVFLRPIYFNTFHLLARKI